MCARAVGMQFSLDCSSSASSTCDNEKLLHTQQQFAVLWSVSRSTREFIEKLCVNKLQNSIAQQQSRAKTTITGAGEIRKKIVNCVCATTYTQAELLAWLKSNKKSKITDVGCTHIFMLVIIVFLISRQVSIRTSVLTNSHESSLSRCPIITASCHIRFFQLHKQLLAVHLKMQPKWQSSSAPPVHVTSFKKLNWIASLRIKLQTQQRVTFRRSPIKFNWIAIIFLNMTRLSCPRWARENSTAE